MVHILDIWVNAQGKYVVLLKKGIDTIRNVFTPV